MRTPMRRTLCLLTLLMSPLFAGSLFADDDQAAGIRFFEQKIRPMLVKHCYECHSAESSPLQGGLQLDSKEALHLGGDSGESIVPGKPEESLLIETLHYDPLGYQMPPKGKLPAEVIADFEKWIKMGAPDPRTDDAPQVVRKTFDIDSRRDFWSFQPPHAYPAPEVKDAAWPQSKLDYFVLAKIEAAELTPSPLADRRTLIRRAYFDLIGLPPTYAEIEQFVADPDPHAYEKLIDKLLDSPHYGERWARHWLDVARYAEDNVNMGPHNGPYPNAYRYRDWVVAAINQDVPYDQFLRRQLATDFLDQTGRDDLPALGLIGLSPQNHKELMLAQISLEGVYADEWEDRVDVVSRGLLGLTVACARCHDHKYDPIAAKDYYALAGVFASVRQTTRPLISDEEIAESQPARDEVAAIEAEIATIKANQKELAKEKTEATPNRKTEIQTEVSTLAAQVKEKLEKIAQIKSATPGFVIPVADVVTEEQVRIEPLNETHQQIVFHPNQPRDLPLFIRGNISTPGETVRRRFVEVLSPSEPQPFENGSGRLELADAIVARSNPLTARVIVNRIWMWHFGEGLVDTPSNFGATGSAPSHPQLLDDLAVRFMDQGWSLKRLHREIMLSATYRQASNSPASQKADAIDPANRLLSRFPRLRLDAESYHDSVLAAGGGLDLTMGGVSGDIDNPQFRRRAIYAKISRKSLSQYLQMYDFPDPTIHAERRVETMTALQQLFMMNSPFAKRQAVRLAQLTSGGDLDTRIESIHQTLFGRNPTAEEVAVAKQYLDHSQSPTDDRSTPPYAPPRFAGSRVRADVPNLGSAYAVDFWIRNELPVTDRPITGYFFSRGESASVSADGDHLGIAGTSPANSAGKLVFFTGNRDKRHFVGRTVLTPNQWYHVTLVRDGDQVRGYLNGETEPEFMGSAPASFDTKLGELYLGGRSDRFANFHGQIAAMTIFDRVLTAAEIGRLHQESTASSDEPNYLDYSKSVLDMSPAAHWPLYESSSLAATVRDATAHQRHGKYEGKSPVGYGQANHWVLYCHALLCSNELLFVD
ncbi:DUF1553 domain-containing protein [Blastopirellula sp. J2-11]|uniref:DUF1553 domain-containing protein n=1 Tax=Blastopirellula sp. J2-11 TaxID=2943192 RepID=UPI0021C76854|nr:DUF1553 domain-containing protein [Blastopirellula sp. J2-11]UUO04321.1 DUF1553 domain-containing protein [Blastopirellula sp. J2-11]